MFDWILKRPMTRVHAGAVEITRDIVFKRLKYARSLYKYL